MINTIPTTSGERLSFFQLFNEKGYRIEIPIIQRDYAQGRKSSYDIRNTFIDALFNYLLEGIPNRDLDFVYGSLLINDSNKSLRFIPLDGQQRLTTLFLLHWYLANKENKLIEFVKVFAEQNKEKFKSKFTYETRTSATDFCNKLVSSSIELKELLAEDNNHKNRLSNTIKNQEWYFLSWKNDPTIEGMLVMLDTIHEKFESATPFYKKLASNESPIITFQFLKLEEFGLTDDLYIKMNARGKPLTTFENFKAKLEQYIKKSDFNTQNRYKLVYNGKERDVFVQEYFSFKIDVDWGKLFWNYRNEKSKDDTFDDELMNFIRVVVSNQYAAECKNEKDENLEILIGTQVARKSDDYSDIIKFSHYEKIGALTKLAIEYLIDSFDRLTNGDKKIKTHLKDNFFYDEEEVLKRVLMNEMTLPQRVQFHSYLKFLIYNNGKTEGIYQWMRVVHNLTENTRIDGAEEVAKAIKQIEILLPFSNKILNFLQGDNVHIDFFHSSQVFEEKIKASLINKSTEWKTTIDIAEKNEYFKGQIGFLLEFSEIWDYYEENGNCNWNEINDDAFLERFNSYTSKAILVFDKNGTSSIKDFLWERAVLSKGNYSIPMSVNRNNFLYKQTRDYSWKRLLRIPAKGTKIDDIKIWKERRIYVKDVFDDKNFIINNVVESLKKICKIVPDDWRIYFIENPELFRYCEQAIVWMKSETEILLFKQSRRNHRQREMYSYNFLLRKLDKNDDFEPFTNAYNKEVKSEDDISFTIIDGWKYRGIVFSIAVYYNNDDDGIPNPFEIRFYKTLGQNNEEKYPDEIKSILASSKFDWVDTVEWRGYWLSRKSERSTLKVIKELCIKLRGL